MAHSLSAKKRVRQNHKRRARNRWRLRTMRAAIKDLREKILHGSVEEAQEAARRTFSVIDRTAQKGVIHKNAAARRKSRLNARLKAKVLASSGTGAS
ncbi:MAG: 30S ribosomal protein S20 [Planctomycetota bacterium]|nr:MAG: 30S ribosomal protein S20 [Planctomycetota bacterium]